MAIDSQKGQLKSKFKQGQVCQGICFFLALMICLSLGIFDIVVTKNTGIPLALQQFLALLQKHVLNSLRNYLVLFASVLPVFFVIISLVIEQQIPKPEDSPSLLIAFDRYEKTNVPYTYQTNNPAAVSFIRAYESALQTARKPATLIDLTANHTGPCQKSNSSDIYSYLGCIGERSLADLSDRYLIGARVENDSLSDKLKIIGLFNNQPYHIPPLTLNYITNALLKQYGTTATRNLTINVVNHPVRRRERERDNDQVKEDICFVSLSSYHDH